MFKKKQGLKLRNKKTRKIKLTIYIIIFYLTFSITYYNILNNNPNKNNQKFIKYILNGGNINNIKDIKLNTIVNNTMNYLLKIDFQNPKTLLNFQNNTNKEKNNINMLKQVSSYIENPDKKETQEPIIYIYNSHQLENYDNKGLEIYGITPNVLMTSYILKEKLTQKGLSTIVEDTNITNFLNINNWDYSASYKASRIFLLEKINEYPSLKYFIDIHRDSISKEESTTTIEGKEYAKILFVVGLENPNYVENQTLANNINKLINYYYPTLSRGIYEKKGEGVDGVYNQDINKGCILIEIGSQNNNINEVFNTTEALVYVLNKYINSDNP